jgi:hypothetical protein
MGMFKTLLEKTDSVERWREYQVLKNKMNIKGALID